MPDDPMANLAAELGIEPTPGTEVPENPEGTPPKGEGQDPTSPDPQTPVEGAKEGEETPDPLLEKLNAIKDDEEEKPEDKPALTAEQQAVLNEIPNAESAKTLKEIANAYTNVVQAFSSGDYDTVEALFAASKNTEILDNLMESIYQKKVASGEWVDRFIAENDKENPQAVMMQPLKALEQKLEKVKQELEQERRGKVQQGTVQQAQKAFQDYQNHVNGLFDQIEFAKGDRPWIMANLDQRIVSDPRLLTAVRSGNVGAVNGIFKKVVSEYLQRDKQSSATTAAKVKQQEQKKPLVASGASAPEGGLPEDIRQVPKGQEDAWLQQQFSKLASEVSKGKR